MSLKPNNLATGDLPVALKPALSYERQLYVSAQQHTVLGTLQVVAPNSGVYTPNQADNNALAAVPQELMMVLNQSVDIGGAGPTNLVVTVIGTDQTNAPLTGTATFSPPTYAQDQSLVFPRGWAQEVTVTAGKKFKTVTQVTVTTDANLATTPDFRLVGLPSLDFSAQGSFRKILTKVKLGYDPAVPIPTAVQDGREKGRYIKKGEIEVGTLDIQGKEVSPGDGLTRYNGARVTGWIIEKKEDAVTTQYIFLLGLVMSLKPEIGEGAEPIMLQTVSSLYELYAMIVAH